MKKRWIIAVIVVLLCLRAYNSNKPKRFGTPAAPLHTISQTLPTRPAVQPSTEPETTVPVTEASTQLETTVPTTEAPTQPETTAHTGIRPEFKEAMDSYEAFYNEYFDFMEEYYRNPTNLSLLGKYASMLAKAEEVDRAFEAWDEGEMSNEELKYYLDVINRVQKRMIDLF